MTVKKGSITNHIHEMARTLRRKGLRLFAEQGKIADRRERKERKRTMEMEKKRRREMGR